jgi:toxin ParE1/3/4
MPRVFKRVAARRDLVQHYLYLAENAGDAVADRFLACAETTFAELSEQPETGAALTLRRFELGAIRKWRVRDDLKKGAITYVKARRPLIPLIEHAAGA